MKHLSGLRALMRSPLRMLLLTLLLDIGLVRAQSTTSPSVTKVIPPSPEAQSFMRYGEIPVDPSTGVPDIQVPLYQVNSGKLSLPVSITYHASGIRVSDVASVVGLGWRLSAGGVLTKTVVGKPDNDASYGMFNYPYLTKAQIDALPQNGSEWQHLKMIAEGTMDGQSDKYFYSAGGKLSGDFFYDNAFNIVKTTYSDSKIIAVSATSYKVIADDGTQYFFEKPEYSHTDMDPPYVSSWWLTKIASADNVDVITFEYQTLSTPNVSFVQSQSITTTSNPTVNYSGSQTNTNPVLLKKIVFNNGYLSFDYAADRKDMQDNRLTAVSVYATGMTAPLRKFQFTHSYFYSGTADDKYNYRMKLDQLAVYDAGSSNIQNYSFEYDQSQTMPPYTQDLGPNNNPFCYAQDYWGYNNGITTNQHLITTVPGYPFSPANRTPDLTYAKTCALTKITYPTGGSTSFEYQLNDGPAIAPSTGSGLRIHRIISKTDATTTATVKRYEYANNLLQMDFDLFSINSYDWEPIVYNLACTWSIANWSTWVSNTLLPYATFNGSPALYQYVDEYTDGIASGVNLKRSYMYAADNDFIISVPSSRYGNQYYKECPWRKGQLQILTDYKYDPVAGYITKRTQNYSYTDFRVNTVISGTKLERIHPLVNPCSYENYTPGATYQQYFTYFDVPIEVGSRSLTGISTTETDDDNNSITTTESTAFASSSHLFPTSKSVSGSAGETWRTDITYPHDYAGTSVYDQLIAKNQISTPIEQKKYKIKSSATTYLESSKTYYNFWGGNSWSSTPTSIIVPQYVETQRAGFGAEPRIQYLAYDDQANIASVSKANGPKTSYFYSYGGAYPIAQVTNADYSAIVTAVGGQTVIDNLKNNPTPTDAQVNGFVALLRNTANLPNAQVMSYTYKPLVGMTSATDAKGTATYYEYDDFQRLRFIRDKDNNIVKAFCYNYKGQQTNCYTPGSSGSGPTQIYARIEIANTYSTFSGDYEYSYTSGYGDVYIRFYSDAACLNPVNLSSAMTVSVTMTTQYNVNYSSGSYSSTTDYNAPDSNWSYYLGTLSLYDYTDFDNGSYYSYSYYDYSYDVVVHSGSSYIPVTFVYI
ncbi:hypothetical protein HQ865_22710 [Mucilaginibacter mali]|uniref:YD repeat-containing protein n=1 Tax=Mucilaginibacter mali TaxID=2740462 RepID=A0A7D4TS08_9SPHI|nr:hypothetical protein [Mucilaginibacter mali]QKJ32454.1 hypothetical protein HQ865_22710 [Mucilaginibacter mali]